MGIWIRQSLPASHPYFHEKCIVFLGNSNRRIIRETESYIFEVVRLNNLSIQIRVRYIDYIQHPTSPHTAHNTAKQQTTHNKPLSPTPSPPQSQQQVK